ncbi:type II toxin-antitoxin system VapC family toxin [bacterium]|nr:type II toxin-antitoxin system VapC family toxin [bacterium]MBU1753687.1 type II toxin-antitoxin system VapC family toxin [bacterium]
METSVISYLSARRSRDVVIAAWQEVTLEFWERHRGRYDVYVSELVVAEASSGDSIAAERRVALLRGIPELPVSQEAKILAKALMAEGGVTRKADIDALHIAVATVGRMDYILTWNFRHLDNPILKPRIREICVNHGHRCPEICTPLEITEAPCK